MQRCWDVCPVKIKANFITQRARIISYSYQVTMVYISMQRTKHEMCSCILPKSSRLGQDNLFKEVNFQLQFEINKMIQSRSNETTVSAIIKEQVHVFSCAYIEGWTHLENLQSTQEARIARLRLKQLLHSYRTFHTSHIYTSIYTCLLGTDQSLNTVKKKISGI